MSQSDLGEDVPEAWAMSLSDVFARYMVSRFNALLSSDSQTADNAAERSRLSLRALCEADRMVSILLEAYRNKVVIDTIDIIRLGEQANRTCARGLSGKMADEAEIEIDAESRQLELLTEPSVVTDRSGYILLWYLPGFVSDPNQSYIWDQLYVMDQALGDSVSSRSFNVWRTSKDFFSPIAELRGAINLSPAWFQQGRNGANYDPEVSALLKTGREPNGGRRWLADMCEHSALLSASLAIMHPEMYVAGREVMLKLHQWAREQDEVEIEAVLPIWPSIFNAMSVIVNRMSPLHKDLNGRPQWFDLLVTVGNYVDLDFVIPTISRRLRYNPGTAVAFSGQMLQHGVGQAHGDRAVISFYMRDNVHQFVDVPRSNFMEYSKVGRSFISPLTDPL